jgi:hypothetical protein
LDDGLEFFVLARPPSSAGVSPYSYGTNSYDETHSGLCQNPTGVRDGDVEHINRQEDSRMRQMESISQINSYRLQNKPGLSGGDAFPLPEAQL